MGNSHEVSPKKGGSTKVEAPIGCKNSLKKKLCQSLLRLVDPESEGEKEKGG